MPEILFSRFSVRCAGMPFEVLEDFRWRAAISVSDDSQLEPEMKEKRAHLWGLLDVPDFLDALGSLNPELLLFVTRKRSVLMGTAKRNSTVRGVERTLHNVLFRVCSRNDSTGTAGMTFSGIFDADSNMDFQVNWGPKRFGKRLVFASPSYIKSLQHRLNRHFLHQLKAPSGH